MERRGLLGGDIYDKILITGVHVRRAGRPEEIAQAIVFPGRIAGIPFLWPRRGGDAQEHGIAVIQPDEKKAFVHTAQFRGSSAF